MEKYLKHGMNLLMSRQLIWLTIFAVAMGMLESAVVIYLRELYYPEGFDFPLQPTSYLVAVIELLRELATLIMLLAIGVLVGKNKTERFAVFIYSFAIWDIFYYVFLYLILEWPVTLSDWDVLFLLPMMWVGPVWAPVLLSCLMIVLAISVLYFSRLGNDIAIKGKEWGLMIVGSIVAIVGFCKDFYVYMTGTFPEIQMIDLFFSEKTFDYVAKYVPLSFELLLFSIGTGLITLAICMFVYRQCRTTLIK